jgi:hypothetical protein
MFHEQPDLSRGRHRLEHRLGDHILALDEPYDCRTERDACRFGLQARIADLNVF